MKISRKFELLSLGCLLSVSQAIDLNKNRTWYSEDGRTIEARVLDLSDEERTVEMQRVDGLKFALSWDQLSMADQALLAEAAKKATIAAPKLPLNIPVELPTKHILKFTNPTVNISPITRISRTATVSFNKHRLSRTAITRASPSTTVNRS